MEKKRFNLIRDRLQKISFKHKAAVLKIIGFYLLVLIIFAGSWILSIPGGFSYQIKVEEGSIAQQDVYAPRDFWAVDREATRVGIDKKIAEMYRPICDLDIKSREKTLNILFELIEMKDLSPERKEEIKKYLTSEYPQYLLPAEFREALVKANKKDILVDSGKSERQSVNLDQTVDLTSLKNSFIPYLERNLKLDSEEIKSINKNFTPTLIFNSEKSSAFRDELANSVSPQEKFIAQGENIVRKGEKITAEQLGYLDNLNKLTMKINLKKKILGIGGLIFIVSLIIIIFLHKFPQQFNLLNQYLGLFAIVSIGILFLARYFLKWFPPVFIPVASGAMLIALLLSSSLAIAFAFYISILVGNLAGGNFPILVILFLGSLVGILAVRHVRQRLDLFRAVILIGLVNMAAILSFGLMNDLKFPEIGRQILWGWGNGLLCVIIVTGLSPVFESIFKISSDINLLELSDLNRPVLRKLMIEASGTYHHSLIVGNLAEAATERIKANSLLARVGSYYHDIGKLYKPEYFSENQAKSKSRHEKITPRMSSLVIAAHVKEGVALAKECKLPQVLIDFIEQHHGNTLMWMFYQSALEKKGANEIKEDDFRYPGPKPQSREIAVVMLADAVEAASRTLDDPTPSRIRNLVYQIINDKFLDAQLEECNLTLRDLHEIGESFIHTLTGLFHVRVEYPQGEKKNNGRRTKKKNGTDFISLGEKDRSEDSGKIET